MSGLEKIPPKKQVRLASSIKKKTVKTANLKKLKKIEGKAAGKVGKTNRRTTEVEAKRKERLKQFFEAQQKYYTSSQISGIGVEPYSPPPPTIQGPPVAPFDSQ